MQTQVIRIADEGDSALKKGAEIIKQGGLVAFPTETVYGLGANGFDGSAVRAIYEAKDRPSDNPSILHIADPCDVYNLWSEVSPAALKLMETFWPGPLTIIGKKSDIIPAEVTGGLDTVAIRMPSSKTAQKLIRYAGVPIAAPSANRSGRPSPTMAEHVITDMKGRIPLILDGGACEYGVESTVISLVGEPTILRPGAITQEMIAAIIGEVKLANSILKPLKEGELAASPGMKYRHYAPKADVLVVCGEADAVARRINSLYNELSAEGKQCEIAATVQTKDFYIDKRYVILGDRDHPETLCANLFTILRELDLRSNYILAEGIEPRDMGLAYMNRLLRAAGFRVIHV